MRTQEETNRVFEDDNNRLLGGLEGKVSQLKTVRLKFGCNRKILDGTDCWGNVLLWRRICVADAEVHGRR